MAHQPPRKGREAPMGQREGGSSRRRLELVAVLCLSSFALGALCVGMLNGIPAEGYLGRDLTTPDSQLSQGVYIRGGSGQLKEVNFRDSIAEGTELGPSASISLQGNDGYDGGGFAPHMGTKDARREGAQRSGTEGSVEISLTTTPSRPSAEVQAVGLSQGEARHTEVQSSGQQEPSRNKYPPPNKVPLGAMELPECPFLQEGHETFKRDNVSATARVLESQLELLEKLVTFSGGQYYLTYGTLIGAVRHGGLIPWDYDMDVAVIPKATDGWEDMYRKMKDYLREYNETCRGLTRVGDLSYKEYNEPDFFVDWFDPYYWKNHSEYHPPVMRLHYLRPEVDVAEGHEFRKMCFGDQIDLFLEERSVNDHPLNQYGPLCRCYFNGVPTRCLSNSTGYLTELFGDWETPSDQFGIMTAEDVQDRGFCDFMTDDMKQAEPKCVVPEWGEASRLAKSGVVPWDDNGKWEPIDLVRIGDTVPPPTTPPTVMTTATELATEHEMHVTEVVGGPEEVEQTQSEEDAESITAAQRTSVTEQNGEAPLGEHGGQQDNAQATEGSAVQRIASEAPPTTPPTVMTTATELVTEDEMNVTEVVGGPEEVEQTQSEGDAESITAAQGTSATEQNGEVPQGEHGGEQDSAQATDGSTVQRIASEAEQEDVTSSHVAQDSLSTDAPATAIESAVAGEAA